MLDLRDAEYAYDPVLIAAEAAERAEQTLMALPVRTVIDELTAEFVSAEARLEVAETAFARAVPATPLGALVKLRALHTMLRGMPMPEDSLELMHLGAIEVYLERMIDRL